jgi:hypothetical protein
MLTKIQIKTFAADCGFKEDRYGNIVGGKHRLHFQSISVRLERKVVYGPTPGYPKGQTQWVNVGSDYFKHAEIVSNKAGAEGAETALCLKLDGRLFNLRKAVA